LNYLYCIFDYFFFKKQKYKKNVFECCCKRCYFVFLFFTILLHWIKKSLFVSTWIHRARWSKKRYSHDNLCVFCLILSSTTKKMPSNQCCLFIRLVLNKATSSCNKFFIAARTEHRITQHFRVRRLITTPAYSLGRSGFIDC